MNPWKMGFFAAFVASTAAMHVTAGAADVGPYVLAVVPQFEQRTIHEIWEPIAERLVAAAGRPVRLVGVAGIPEFEKGLLEGRYDFAYMNPYDVLLASRAQGYRPLVRDMANDLQGVLVVSKRSEIMNVSEIAGRVVAFPAPNALGATLLMRAELRRELAGEVVPRFVGSHTSVYLHVAQGLTVAGAGVGRTLSEQPEDVRKALRVIYRTRPVPAHAVCVHPRVPEPVREAVREAFIRMGREPRGRRLLAGVPMTVPGVAELADYQSLQRLGLERFYERP